MYKLYKSQTTNEELVMLVKENLIYTFPKDPDNTDYQQFKIDLTNGVALHDANNNVMTANQISAFVATLP